MAQTLTYNTWIDKYNTRRNKIKKDYFTTLKYYIGIGNINNDTLNSKIKNTT